MESKHQEEQLDIPYNLNGMNNSNVLSLYMDQTINNALVKEMRQITKKFDIKNLVSIIFLMGIDNLKKYVNEILSTLPQYVLKLLNIIYNRFFETKKHELILDTKHIEFDDTYNFIHTININEGFEELLLNYIVINNGTNVHYDEKIINYAVISKNRFRYESNIHNISIKFQGYDIYLTDKFQINYLKTNKEIKNVSSLERDYMNNDLILLNRFTSILNLSYNRQIEICKAINDYIVTNTKYGNIDSNDFQMSTYLLTLVPNQNSLELFKRIALVDGKLLGGKHNYLFKNCDCSNNKKIIVIITMVIIYTQFYIEYNDEFTNDCTLFGYRSNSHLLILDKDYSPQIKKLYKEIFHNKSERIKIYNEVLNVNLSEKDKLNYFKDTYKGSADTGECKLNLRVYLDNEIQDKQPSNALFEDFIYYLYSMNHKDAETNDITVYNINVKYTETLLQEYEPAKITEKKLQDGSIEKIVIPEKQKEIEYKVYADMEKINTIYKDFSTLYLKKKDEFKLKNILETFDKKKELYKKIGIPFKFGCLLHGSPGTGKTSAIKAIASFLKRDIYYLDISKVKTNEELTKIFKDINENTKDNGVIVMEDIDAMSDIVLERSERKNCAELQMSKDEDKLTLSHLLNILDGTLTRDDMIFIATTNCVEKLDSALKRPGRFDVSINLSECDRYQFEIIYKNILQRELTTELLNLLEEHSITPAKFIYSLIQFMGYSQEDITDIYIIDNVLSSLE